MSFNDDILYAMMEIAWEEQTLAEDIRLTRGKKLFVVCLVSLFAAINITGAIVTKNPYWQSIFIELASASGFFIGVLFVIQSQTKQRKWQVVCILLTLALLSLIIAYFLDGLLQSMLIEFGIGLVAIGILDLVIQAWFQRLDARTQKLQKDIEIIRGNLPESYWSNS